MAGVIRPSERRVVVFDLDEGLLDRREAWLFAIEEAVAATTGRRLSARPLLAEYRMRPWREAVGILVPEDAARSRCERLAGEMFRRSALKRLLVHDGIGMALDAVREAGMEIGAITATEHREAVKQVQSTGLDRFVAVLSATRAAENWDPVARWNDCLRFLEQAPDKAVFVSPVVDDLRAISQTGALAIAAGWGGSAPGEGLGHPGELLTAIRGAGSKNG